MPVIYSTKSSPTIFADYAPAPNGNLPRVLRRVVIEGNAGVAILGDYANPKTLAGYASVVSDQDYMWLKDHPVFKRMIDRGFLMVSPEKSTNPEKLSRKAQNAAQNMAKDVSAPLTDVDYKSGGRIGEPDLKAAKIT